jgi:hypothetical protein
MDANIDDDVERIRAESARFVERLTFAGSVGRGALLAVF